MSYIVNDDCFKIFDDIDDKSVDLVLVDLPYGQTACDWDVKIDLKLMWKHLKRICKRDAVYIFFTTTKYGYEIIHSNPRWFRYDIVWEKSRRVGFLSANKMPLRQHEMIYVFKEKQGTYNPQKTKGKPYKPNRKTETNVYGVNIKLTSDENKGDRHPTSIVKFNNPKNSVHRTQKPVELCEWLIKTYSNEGDTVLDFTMGSGSSIVACINTNREYIGIEKDPGIFKIAEARIMQKLD